MSYEFYFTRNKDEQCIVRNMLNDVFDLFVGNLNGPCIEKQFYLKGVKAAEGNDTYVVIGASCLQLIRNPQLTQIAGNSEFWMLVEEMREIEIHFYKM